MGYTHYWKRGAGSFEAAAWKALCKDAAAIIGEAGKASIWLAYESDRPATPADVTAEIIRFNGVGEEGHETFAFTRAADEEWIGKDGTEFSFCKTARKPYDAPVCAVLIAAKHHLGKAIRVSSDGEWSEEGWREGARLYARATGRKAACPLDGEG